MSTVMGRPTARTMLVFDDIECSIGSCMSHQKRSALARNIEAMAPAARKKLVSDLLRALAVSKC